LDEGRLKQMKAGTGHISHGWVFFRKLSTSAEGVFNSYPDTDTSFLGGNPSDPPRSLGHQEVQSLINRSFLRTHMFSQGSDGAVTETARRAKRENGGLGEDPPGSTMTY
jgi:hypothetical protein